jgi:hypothetical protein
MVFNTCYDDKVNGEVLVIQQVKDNKHLMFSGTLAKLGNGLFYA